MENVQNNKRSNYKTNTQMKKLLDEAFYRTQTLNRESEAFVNPKNKTYQDSKSKTMKYLEIGQQIYP